MQIVLATHNPKKLVELQRLADERGMDVEFVSLAGFDAPEPREDADSFLGNALIKARSAAMATGLLAMADDSGLCVDALNGMPGILSARWSGAGATDERTLRLLLDQIADVPAERRGARFMCAVALAFPTGREWTTEGEVRGSLLRDPVGENGFGYDPIFVPTDERRTTAQMSPAEKDAISHRGQAVRAMLDIIQAEGLTGAGQ